VGHVEQMCQREGQGRVREHHFGTPEARKKRHTVLNSITKR
jgi:hypothetical protein